MIFEIIDWSRKTPICTKTRKGQKTVMLLAETVQNSVCDVRKTYLGHLPVVSVKF